MVPITREWQERVKEILAKRGRGARSDLAKEIGATPGAITGVLKKGAKGSRLVVAISNALGIPVPVVQVRDERELEWLAVGRDLNPEDWEHVKAIAEALTRKK